MDSIDNLTTLIAGIALFKYQSTIPTDTTPMVLFGSLLAIVAVFLFIIGLTGAIW